MSSHLLCVLFSALVRASGAVPHSRHQGVALEVSASGDLRQAEPVAEESSSRPLMRTEHQGTSAAAPKADPANGADGAAASNDADGTPSETDAASDQDQEGAEDASEPEDADPKENSEAGDAPASLMETLAQIPLDVASAVGSFGHKATDVLYGITGIGDDMDYPFACICGPDGRCVGDSMGTTCKGRAGAGSGADL